MTWQKLSSMQGRLVKQAAACRVPRKARLPVLEPADAVAGRHERESWERKTQTRQRLVISPHCPQAPMRR